MKRISTIKSALMALGLTRERTMQAIKIVDTVLPGRFRRLKASLQSMFQKIKKIGHGELFTLTTIPITHGRRLH